VILQGSLKKLYDEGIERSLLVLRSGSQFLVEMRRHADLEMDHGFGHCRLLRIDDRKVNLIRSVILTTGESRGNKKMTTFNNYGRNW
jgi:hypothetical protein